MVVVVGVKLDDWEECYRHAVCVVHVWCARVSVPDAGSVGTGCSCVATVHAKQHACMSRRRESIPKLSTF